MKLKMIEDEQKKSDQVSSPMITPQQELVTEGDLKVPDSETKEVEAGSPNRKTLFIDDEEIHDSFMGLSPDAQQDIQLLDNVNEALYHYERVNKQFFKMQSA